MTHDELIDKLIENLIKEQNINKFYNPLRAVVELCKPSDWDGDDNFYWKKQIIETIERELR